MITKHSGKTRTQYYPKKASVAFNYGDAVYLDSNEQIAPHPGDGSKILGMSVRTVRSTDSDYTQNTLIPVEVPVEENVQWEFDTSGLVSTDFGRYVGISSSDAGVVDRSTTSDDLIFVTKVLSSTKGVGVFQTQINTNYSGSGNLFVTVAADGSGDYNCDGVADEVEIKAAIAAVNTSGGGIVHIKAGTYNCAADVAHLSNVIVEGDGEATVINIPVNTKRWAFGTASSNCTNAKLRNFKIDTSAQTAGLTNHCVRVYGGQDIEIYGMHLETAGFGIYSFSDTNFSCEKVWIHHNYIHGKCGNDLVGGGPLTDAALDTKDFIVESNWIAQDASASGASTYYTAMDLVGVKNIKFISNIVYGNILFGNERDPNQYSEVSGNEVRPVIGTTTLGAKIAIVDDSNTGDVSGKNRVIGNFVYGGAIEIRGKTDQHINGGVIANNIIVNDANYVTYFQYGIYLQYADQCTITGNQCYANGASTGTDGILLSDSINNQVVGNLFDGYAVGLAGFGTVTGTTVADNYVYNCTATVSSTLMGGVGNSIKNNYGVNPDNLLYAQGNVTGATTFDRKDGDVITATLTDNITVTLSTTRVPRGTKLTLILSQDGSGSHTVTWPSNFKKAGGTLSLSAGASAVDVIKMEFDGTNWREVSRALNQS